VQTITFAQGRSLAFSSDVAQPTPNGGYLCSINDIDNCKEKAAVENIISELKRLTKQ
jgi:hypothetical protein